jgi:RNA polymerase sigma-70 factor (ECF subfamily)
MMRRDPLADLKPLMKRVYAYAAYRLGDGPDAEDATSETLERALRYRKSYDPRKGEPAAWLIGIARHCVDDILRARAYALPLGDDLPDQVDPRELDEDVLFRLLVARAMVELDDRDRELVALRYGADLTAKQIAALQDARPNTIEVALHRALGRLRSAYDTLVEPEPATASRRP